MEPMATLEESFCQLTLNNRLMDELQAADDRPPLLIQKLFTRQGAKFQETKAACECSILKRFSSRKSKVQVSVKAPVGAKAKKDSKHKHGDSRIGG